jgi:hypothetical protein
LEKEVEEERKEEEDALEEKEISHLYTFLIFCSIGVWTVLSFYQLSHISSPFCKNGPQTGILLLLQALPPLQDPYLNTF